MSTRRTSVGEPCALGEFETIEVVWGRCMVLGVHGTSMEVKERMRL
jgi:hypothetical protein